MGKIFSEKFFDVTDKIHIHCRAESTRSGFRHLATLRDNGFVIAQAKECYQNRTWERYEFQTVMRRLAGQGRSKEEQELLRAFVDNYKEDDSGFRMIAGIAALGSIMTDNQADANSWKMRMIKAGLGDRGLDVPDDWDTLTEDEKESRLNKVIATLRSPVL